jgi:hypothetical protein
MEEKPRRKPQPSEIDRKRIRFLFAPAGARRASRRAAAVVTK